jgi:hypothetical protein
MHQDAKQARNRPLTALQRGDGRPLRDEDACNHISPRLRGKLAPIAEYLLARASLWTSPSCMQIIRLWMVPGGRGSTLLCFSQRFSGSIAAVADH